MQGRGLIESLYLSAVGLGLAPPTFWAMPPRELWWFLRASRPDLLQRDTGQDDARWGPLYDLLNNPD